MPVFMLTMECSARAGANTTSIGRAGVVLLCRSATDRGRSKFPKRNSGEDDGAHPVPSVRQWVQGRRPSAERGRVPTPSRRHGMEPRFVGAHAWTLRQSIDDRLSTALDNSGHPELAVEFHSVVRGGAHGPQLPMSRSSRWWVGGRCRDRRHGGDRSRSRCRDRCGGCVRCRGRGRSGSRGSCVSPAAPAPFPTKQATMKVLRSLVPPFAAVAWPAPMRHVPESPAPRSPC